MLPATNQITIRFADGKEDQYKGKTIYWRFQSEPSFSHQSMSLCAGNTSESHETTFSHDTSVRCNQVSGLYKRKYFYATLVDDSTGECVSLKDSGSEFLEFDVD
jgi:hypothetical protein